MLAVFPDFLFSIFPNCAGTLRPACRLRTRRKPHRSSRCRRSRKSRSPRPAPPRPTLPPPTGDDASCTLLPLYVLLVPTSSKSLISTDEFPLTLPLGILTFYVLAAKTHAPQA